MLNFEWGKNNNFLVAGGGKAIWLWLRRTLVRWEGYPPSEIYSMLSEFTIRQRSPEPFFEVQEDKSLFILRFTLALSIRHFLNSVSSFKISFPEIS